MEAALRLRAVPQSVTVARHETAAFIGGLPIPAEVALLLVSELVANAVQHGAAPIVLRLRWDGRALEIAVTDDDPRIECVRRASGSHADDRGRGLRLTHRLAESWGARAGPDLVGKTVWATVATP